MDIYEFMTTAFEAVYERSATDGIPYMGYIFIGADEPALLEHARREALGFDFFGDYAIRFPMEVVSEQHAKYIMVELMRIFYVNGFSLLGVDALPDQCVELEW